jgi:hypothetical protein
MLIGEERTVAFNEYGSNLIKYKYDPLAVIEAKFAMTQEKKSGEESGKNDGQRVTTEGSTLKITKEEFRVISESQGIQTHQSPELGTQEAPGAEWSSQEEVGEKMVEGEVVKVNQPREHNASPNWNEIEREGDIEGSDTEKMDNLGDDYVKNKESANADQDMEESLNGEVQADKTHVEEDKKQTR